MKSLNEWLHIVGIDPCPAAGILSQKAGSQDCPQPHRPILPLPNDTALLAGAARLLELFPDFSGQKLPLTAGDLDSFIARIKSYRGQRVVVLASGDPNFYGLAATLLQHVDRKEVAIYPAVSSMQWAFAKAKIPWHDAALISLHGRPMHHLARIWPREKIGIFTDRENTPLRIASFLLDRGARPEGEYFLLENLGAEDEKITCGRLKDLAAAQAESAPLNILLLIKAASPDSPFSRYPAPGLPEEEFYHTAGLITKREIRAAVLSFLRPQEDSILWDIGAGSGSVSIEASRLIRSGLILAVEKKPAEVENIIKNRQKFQVLNLEVILGEAPIALAELPDPDRIFLGGSGRSLGHNLVACWQRLKKGGVMVINAITLESLNTAREFLASQARRFDIIAIQVSRKKELAESTIMEPSAPVYICLGEKDL